MMEHKKFNLEDVRFRTYMQKSRLEDYARFLADADKTQRLSEQECIVCFYNTKIGGAAMTDSPCGLCEVTMHFGSTNVDRLCTNCSINHRLCKHCGADIELKGRNKL